LQDRVLLLRGIARIEVLERRAGIEPANTGFADLRVSHFTTGAFEFVACKQDPATIHTNEKPTVPSGRWVWSL
jgi:hypothetical protein